MIEISNLGTWESFNEVGSSSSSSLFLIILASGSKRVVFLNPGDLIQISFLSGDF